MEKYQPAKVYAVEWSEDFLAELETKSAEPLQTGKLETFHQDAKDLSFFAKRIRQCHLCSQCDLFFESFVRLFERVCPRLEARWEIMFGVVDNAQKMDKTIFVNQDWNVCVQAMRHEDALVGEARLFKTGPSGTF